MDVCLPIPYLLPAGGDAAHRYAAGGSAPWSQDGLAPIFNERDADGRTRNEALKNAARSSAYGPGVGAIRRAHAAELVDRHTSHR